jgi:phosphatidylglycerophosphatase C
MSSDNRDSRITLSCAEAGWDRPRLVVFDFDNTLYAGDSGTQFLTWLLRQNWWRAIAAALISPVIAPLWLSANTRRRAVSTYLWIGTVGARCGEISNVIDRYTAAGLARLRSRLRPQGMDTLTAYRHAGDQVVVVTGAPLELVRTVLASDLSDPVHVVGSTSRRFMGGLVLDGHCYGVNKLAMLHDAGYTAPLAIAYSDNTIDLPLLARAVKPIVVNPRASRVAAFQRVLGAAVEIQNWDSAACGRGFTDGTSPDEEAL